MWFRCVVCWDVKCWRQKSKCKNKIKKWYKEQSFSVCYNDEESEWWKDWWATCKIQMFSQNFLLFLCTNWSCFTILELGSIVCRLQLSLFTFLLYSCDILFKHILIDIWSLIPGENGFSWESSLTSMEPVTTKTPVYHIHNTTMMYSFFITQHMQSVFPCPLLPQCC